MKKINIAEILRMKNEERKITCITAYDYTSAALVGRSGIDLILVGDSASMVVLGYQTTIPVGIDEMILFSKAVRRGNKRSLIVGDMPFMSYQASDEDAVRNGGKFIKDGNVDAVKIEGGMKMKSRVEALTHARIPVMGHVGLMPQTSPLWSGYRVQGRTDKTAKEVIKDAIAIEEAGAFAVVLEMVTSEVAKIITEKLSIPTIGIGSGPDCDFPIFFFPSLLVFSSPFTPPFLTKYAPFCEDLPKSLASSLYEFLP